MTKFFTPRQMAAAPAEELGVGRKDGVSKRRAVIIEFAADLVCPWCYVGKRRLDRALKMRPGDAPQIVFRSFLLNPEAPRDDLPLSTYLSKRVGTMREISQALDRLIAAGATEGINFRIPRKLSSSLDAHRLVRWARLYGQEQPMLDAILRAYHEEGLDIGNLDVLSEIAAEIGFDSAEAWDFLDGTELRGSVLLDHASLHDRGLSGVPCLIVQGRYALAGAQEPEFLLPLLDLAREEEKLLVAAE